MSGPTKKGNFIVQSGVSDIINMARIIMKDVPMPVMMTSHDSVVAIVEDLISGEENLGSTKELKNLLGIKENANVAQSVEQNSRKVEVAGSNPVVGSMKLNKEQVDELKLIVHYRLQLEDLRKSVEAAEQALATTSKAQTDAKRNYDGVVKRAESRGKEYENSLYEAEARLRKLIVEDVLVKGVPEPPPETEKPTVIEEHEDLGRAE